MPKTIIGKELDAQLDRLVTEQRQLMRKFKALEAASCEKESEADAFYTLLKARFNKAAEPDEFATYKKVFQGQTVSDGAAAAAAAAVAVEPSPAEPTEEEIE